MKLGRFLSIAAILILALALIPQKFVSAADACSINYSIANDWGSGATVNATITNTGTTAITSWTLTWTFPGNQVITNLWNGTYTQSGSAVTVTNANYNGSIAANGGTAGFGFNLTYSGSNNVPTSFSINGVVCGGGTNPTNTSTRTSTSTTTRTNTPTGSSTTSRTSTRTSTRTATATGPTFTQTRTPTRTNTPTRTLAGTFTSTFTFTPTGPTGTLFTGNATYFTALGSPYGGCGITQSALDSQNFVALNVQNTPGDYSTFLSRPISSQYANQIGLFNNGLNCGRWVRVTISDYCNGTNDGAQNQPFCRGGSGWTSDQYNGATLDMIVADSCQDNNAWCRDDPYHLDLAQAALNLFVKNGLPIGDMYPNHWNNRHIQWQFIPAPNYSGDINIGFIQNAQIWWTPIAITHLQNGIHGVDYFANGIWTKATMDSDMGQTYLIGPITTGGTTYQIRVYDVNDQLINNGRIYNFAFPASCGTNCSSPFTQVTYTIQ
jgi:hypothetical protein